MPKVGVGGSLQKLEGPDSPIPPSGVVFLQVICLILQNPFKYSTRASRVYTILQQLPRCPNEAYFSFRDAVRNIGRADLVRDHLPDMPQYRAGSAAATGAASAAST